MSYVNLKTLGDTALFYTREKSCYALSNPNRWGYVSNSVYVSTVYSVDVSVCSGDDKKCTRLLTRPEEGSFVFDWCFRHLQSKTSTKDSADESASSSGKSSKIWQSFVGNISQKTNKSIKSSIKELSQKSNESMLSYQRTASSSQYTSSRMSDRSSRRGSGSVCSDINGSRRIEE
ncbi:unnamed protein product [Trifolium pratense]|uniref:Uncharacterized protein n=1 Tax=Trifolium pratense TaxID=57577 RepID=A0ACB0I8J9_TRIPR|nr:unnamed protein product [Trifolium pratense]